MGFFIPMIATAATAAEGMFASIGASVFGSAAAAGTAATTATSALTLGKIGTALSAAGALYGGVSSYEAGKYQAKVLNMQAKYADAMRANALAAGSQKESRLKMEIARTIGAQRAAEAANGVDVGVGSAVDIADSTRLEGAADVAVAHYQALQEAYGYSQDAWNARANASAAKSAGRNALIGSIFEAGGTLLSGASSLNKKRFGMEEVGIGGRPKSIDDLLRASPSQRLAWGS